MGDLGKLIEKLRDASTHEERAQAIAEHVTPRLNSGTLTKSQRELLAYAATVPCIYPRHPSTRKAINRLTELGMLKEMSAGGFHGFSITPAGRAALGAQHDD